MCPIKARSFKRSRSCNVVAVLASSARKPGILDAGDQDHLRKTLTETAEIMGYQLQVLHVTDSAFVVECELRATQSIAQLVNSLKGVSSRRLQADRPGFRKKVGGVLWSTRYMAVSKDAGAEQRIREFLERTTEAQDE